MIKEVYCALITGCNRDNCVFLIDSVTGLYEMKTCITFMWAEEQTSRHDTLQKYLGSIFM